ncbi:biotin--[acetyl-CoA-carboxylase] ligase [Actinomyces bowdenii]|uniref:biotin--[acetyl-CoA-carboxylase] ligase n=1 Tax=Actinomyces bowdenii TaxID=131109 RepID=UPI001ABCD0CB|nr:biotin--[acetyl-CoA-carboxylase] ligase [Actinomyces bowdenii]MBO3725323.1 biotin--[acetyl-CoA-carboxylase] ligase [Actinomyces bowdenii]
MTCATSTAGSDTSAFSPLRVVPMTGSTQDDLRAELTGAGAGHWPHFSALHALGQSAGRGRSGRAWTTPATGALTVSVVLRPLVPVEALAWLPLLAGLAVRDALAPRVDPLRWRLSTKWPNDVVALPAPGGERAPAPPEVEGWGTSRKLAGVLAELVPLPGLPLPEGLPSTRDQAPAVVLGIGVNVRQGVEQLPVPWAASLRTLGVAASPEEAREEIGAQLRRRLAQWEEAGGDPQAAGGGLAHQLREACTTLGQHVSVQAPSGSVEGLAIDLAPGLVLRTGSGTVVLQAGDVRLVRAHS